MLKSLDLQSEAYAPYGNLAADGFRKLLGTPSVGLLQTVIREAIQNCCDAAKHDNGTKIRIRLRRLSTSQLEVMRENVFSQLPKPETSENAFSHFLYNGDSWVLEICDFGTTGLAGPTRADILPDETGATDFIDFLRNVGSSRDTAHGGGTYGYGKTSLYLSSRCSAILVDTQTTYNFTDTRRLMGCHLGSAYKDSSSLNVSQRFTGRHWWGTRSDNGGIVEPIENQDAIHLTDALGFPTRNPHLAGTSIMIIDPVFVGIDGETPQNVMGMIAETILMNFWPRLLIGTAPEKKLDIKLEINGEDYLVPEPDEFPPLNVFSRALQLIKSDDGRTQNILYGNQHKLLGKLAITKSVRAERTSLLPSELSIVPSLSSHIAVMRPVELVVRYYEGDPLPDKRVEWAGVFICNNDDEVESSFAAAEPPTHDDWEPSILPNGKNKSYVRTAIRKIQEAARNVSVGVAPPPPSSEGPSLAGVSSQLGSFLAGSKGQGAGSFPSKPRGGRKSLTKSNRLSQPVFKRLENDNGRIYAVFESRLVRSEDTSNIILHAEPRFVMDGNSASVDSTELTPPEIIDWQTSEGEILSTRSDCIAPHKNNDLFIRVSVPDDYAVTLKAYLQDEETTT